MGERGNTPPGNEKSSMKKIGELVPELMALEMNEFFGSLGYKHILVYSVKKTGTVEITITVGRVRPPSKKDIARFNAMKLNGVCYTVNRVKWLRLFKRPLKLWDSRNWDHD